MKISSIHQITFRYQKTFVFEVISHFLFCLVFSQAGTDYTLEYAFHLYSFSFYGRWMIIMWGSNGYFPQSLSSYNANFEAWPISRHSDILISGFRWYFSQNSLSILYGWSWNLAEFCPFLLRFLRLIENAAAKREYPRFQNWPGVSAFLTQLQISSFGRQTSWYFNRLAESHFWCGRGCWLWILCRLVSEYYSYAQGDAAASQESFLYLNQDYPGPIISSLTHFPIFLLRQLCCCQRNFRQNWSAACRISQSG